MADNTTFPQVQTGLINTAPGPVPQSPDQPVNVTQPTNPPMAATPQQTAPSTQSLVPAAPVSTYTPKDFTVKPEQTTAGQIHDIIASGSPLMQQAETNARFAMNQRGLINSSIGVTAGQSAVIAAAQPIAAADAAAYERAATNTTSAQNTALAAGAQAQNTSALQKAQSDTSTFIANLQSNTTLTAQRMQDETNKFLGNLQSNTQLSLQDKSAHASMALAAVNNTSAQTIAKINADTSLSIQDKQAQTQQILASMNNENARIVQQMQNDGNLQNIMAQGTVNTKITELTNANRTLLQTSSGAASLYNQALSNLASISANVNLSVDQKAQALNDGVAQLQDALNVLNQIAGLPDVQSMLTFGTGANAANLPVDTSNVSVGEANAPVPGLQGYVENVAATRQPSFYTNTFR